MQNCDVDIAITVIIPVYNNARFLYKCLDSVLSQSLKEIEIICINDGSTDKSLEILNKYGECDSRICVYSIPNSGSGKARNVGIHNANGKYIAFLDSDDRYFEDDILETLFLTAEEKKVDICGGSLCRYINGKVIYEKGKLQFEKDGYVKFKDYQYCKGYTRFIYNTNMLKKNNVFFPYYLRNQDPPFLLRALLCTGEFYAIKKIVYWHCVRPGHVNWTTQRLCDCMRGTAYMLYVSKNNNLEHLHTELVRQYVNELKFYSSMMDLKDKKIRKAIKGIEQEIDYDLIYRAGVIKRYENVRLMTFWAILRKRL